MLYQSILRVYIHVRLIQRVPGPYIVDISTKFDQFGSIWLVVRNVRIQRRWLWYFADTPGLSILTSLPRSILIRYVLLQEIVRENRVFG